MEDDREHGLAAPPGRVLDAYRMRDAALEHVRSGHINVTWIARWPDGSKAVLQRVNEIFPRETQYDIAAVTAELARKGVSTARLLETESGELFCEHEGSVWRALSYIDGESFETVDTAGKAREAGRVLAQFHAAVADFDYRFRSTRGNVHGLERHLAALQDALARHSRHSEIDSVRPLAAEVERNARALPAIDTSLEQAVHGDPKISNVMFERGQDRAICLIDLDTVTRMPLVWELGDAFRSWCNRASEDSPDAGFSAELFEAAIRGYAGESRALLSRVDPAAVTAAAAIIAVELAARFCADALNESYFGWDSARFDSASRHNQARTKAQLGIADSVIAQDRVLSAIVRDALA